MSLGRAAHTVAPVTLSTRLREYIAARWRPVTLAAAATGLIGLLGLGWQEHNDYISSGQAGVEALRHWDLRGFLQSIKVDAGSYILRAPFVMLGNLWGAGPHAAYRLLAVPGLLSAALLAVALWQRASGTGLSRRAQVLSILLIAGSPFLLSALLKAHPEEPLGAVLCLAAVWAAARQRWFLAVVLLGVAVGNKPWAVVAGIPVLILLDGRRGRAMAVAAAAAAVVYATFLLVGVDGLRSQLAALHASTGPFKPWQVWWFFGDPNHLHHEMYGTLRPLYREGPALISQWSHPLAVFVPAALSLAVAPRLRQRPRCDVLLLLAIAFLLRGMLDVWNNVYYELPFIFTLVAWEVSARRRAPLLSLVVTLTGWLVLAMLPLWISPEAQALAYLAWSVPLLVGLLAVLLQPQASEATAVRPRRRTLGRVPPHLEPAG